MKKCIYVKQKTLDINGKVFDVVFQIWEDNKIDCYVELYCDDDILYHFASISISNNVNISSIHCLIEELENYLIENKEMIEEYHFENLPDDWTDEFYFLLENDELGKFRRRSWFSSNGCLGF